MSNMSFSLNSHVLEGSDVSPSKIWRDMNKLPCPTTLRLRGLSVKRPMSRLVFILEAGKALQTRKRASTLDSTSNNDPLGSSNEPLIMRSMMHYPRGDPRSSGRHIYIEWHNNNSLTDHLTFTIGPPPNTQGKEAGDSDWYTLSSLQPHEERRKNGNKKESFSSAVTPGCVSNVTSLIRDAKDNAVRMKRMKRMKGLI